MNDAYGKTMVFDAFFNSPDIPDDQVGGWLVRGHDREDVYQEYVVHGEWTNESSPDDWIDWIRVPIKRGSVLLTA
jgi:hypothetical protein